MVTGYNDGLMTLMTQGPGGGFVSLVTGTSEERQQRHKCVVTSRGASIQLKRKLLQQLYTAHRAGLGWPDRSESPSASPGPARAHMCPALSMRRSAQPDIKSRYSQGALMSLCPGLLARAHHPLDILGIGPAGPFLLSLVNHESQTANYDTSNCLSVIR